MPRKNARPKARKERAKLRSKMAALRLSGPKKARVIGIAHVSGLRSGLALLAHYIRKEVH